MTRKITLCGVLSTVAIAVSSLERFVAIQPIISLPGIKLGLANCIILFALIRLDLKCAFSIMFIKAFTVSLLFTGLTSFVYSFVGGLLSLFGMWLLLKMKRAFSVFGVSIAGASLFNIGQIFAAAFLLKSIYIFKYLPILLLSSLFTGAIIGVIVYFLSKKLHIGWL